MIQMEATSHQEQEAGEEVDVTPLVLLQAQKVPLNPVSHPTMRLYV